MDSAALIELKDLVFGYENGRTVLDGLNFRLMPGQRVGLVGSNGSGKTTLLHLIMGLLRPRSGTVAAFGRAREKEEDFHEMRTRIGLVFQDPEDQLFCPTVAEDVAFGPFNLGWERDKVESAVRDTLARLGLNGFENRITYRLSFGEKRLVSLASVLAMAPEALLMDEPTAGLDQVVVDRLVETLNDLDIPLLLVSHDEAFLETVATSRTRLEHGRISFHG